MNMFSQLNDIDLILRNDEKLLRLLYYKPEYFSDDPLDENKGNILDFDKDELTEILNNRIKFTPVTDDMDDNPICRIIAYPAPRKPKDYNYMMAKQYVHFDIFAHSEYNDVDMRLAKLCDRINDLFSTQKTTGLGKSQFVSGDSIGSPFKNYLGYRMIYGFGSMSANA